MNEREVREVEEILNDPLPRSRHSYASAIDEAAPRLREFRNGENVSPGLSRRDPDEPVLLAYVGQRDLLARLANEAAMHGVIVVAADYDVLAEQSRPFAAPGRNLFAERNHVPVIARNRVVYCLHFVSSLCVMRASASLARWVRHSAIALCIQT